MIRAIGKEIEAAVEAAKESVRAKILEGVIRAIGKEIEEKTLQNYKPYKPEKKFVMSITDIDQDVIAKNYKITNFSEGETSPTAIQPHPVALV